MIRNGVVGRPKQISPTVALIKQQVSSYSDCCAIKDQTGFDCSFLREEGSKSLGTREEPVCLLFEAYLPRQDRGSIFESIRRCPQCIEKFGVED